MKHMLIMRTPVEVEYPADEGFVIEFGSTPSIVTDGPYAEAKELFNGFWIIQTSTKQEAVEWAKRCPLGSGDYLKVRRVNEVTEFDQDNEHIQKEYQWREELGSDDPVQA